MQMRFALFFLVWGGLGFNCVVLGCKPCSCGDFTLGLDCTPTLLAVNPVSNVDPNCTLLCTEEEFRAIPTAMLTRLTTLQSFFVNLEKPDPYAVIPTQIGQMTALTNLYHSHQIGGWGVAHTIPTQVGRLANLEHLTVLGALGTIPSQIGRLSSLLDYSVECDWSLPSQIGLLSQLTLLSSTSDPPPQIGNLKQLKALKFESSIVSQIGLLTNLQTMSWANGRVSSIPSQIGLLTNLQTLSLFQTTIETYPPEIMNLAEKFSGPLSSALAGNTSYLGPLSYSCSWTSPNKTDINVPFVGPCSKYSMDQQSCNDFLGSVVSAASVSGCEHQQFQQLDNSNNKHTLICTPYQNVSINFGPNVEPSKLSAPYVPVNPVVPNVTIYASDPQTLGSSGDQYYATSNVTFHLEWNVPDVKCSGLPFPDASGTCCEGVVPTFDGLATEWKCAFHKEKPQCTFAIDGDRCGTDMKTYCNKNKPSNNMTVWWLESPITNISRSCEYCANEIIFLISFTGNFAVNIPTDPLEKLNLTNCVSPRFEKMIESKIKITCQPNDGANVTVVAPRGFATDVTPLKTPSDSAGSFAISDQTPPSVVVSSPGLSRGDFTRLPIVFVADISEIDNGTLVETNLVANNCANQRTTALNATRFQVECDPAGGIEVSLNVTHGAVFDRAGNPNTVGPFSFFNVFSDNTPPLFVTVMIKSNNTANPQLAALGNELVVIVRCNKPLLDAHAQISGIPAVANRLNQTTWAFSRIVSSFETQGVATFVVQAFDLAGNNATTFSSTDGSTVSVITAKPAVIITPPNGFLTSNPMFVFVANSTILADSWHAAVQVSATCGSPKRDMINQTAYSLICEAQANQILKVSVSIAVGSLRDEIGNTNDVSFSSTIIADLVQPSVANTTLTTTNPFGPYMTEFDQTNITIESTKPLTRASVYFNCQPSFIREMWVNSQRLQWNWQISIAPTTTNGLCIFVVELCDLAGNMKNVTLTGHAVTVDTQHPVITVSSAGHKNGDSFVGRKTFTFDASEPIRTFDWSNVIPLLCVHQSTRNISPTRFVLECNDDSTLIVPKNPSNVCKDMAGLDNEPIAQFALTTPQSSGKQELASWEIVMISVAGLVCLVFVAAAARHKQQTGTFPFQPSRSTFPHNPKGWAGNAARLSRQLGVWITEWNSFDKYMENLHKILLQKIPEGPGMQPSGQAGTDIFISYNWGLHEDNVTNNQDCVRRINEFLQARGWTTWMDEQGNMRGDVDIAMAQGIENSKVAIVCLTKKYIDKINGPGLNDNCKFEFTNIMNQKGASEMVIPITMEVFSIANPIHRPVAEIVLTARPAMQQPSAESTTDNYLD